MKKAIVKTFNVVMDIVTLPLKCIYVVAEASEDRYH